MISNFTIVINNFTDVITNLSKASGVSIKSNNLKISEWCLVIAFGLIFFIGVFGNAFVIYVFGSKRKRSMVDWLILYLGVVDFFSSFLNPPLFIYLTINHKREWKLGKLGCKIIPSLGPIMATVSSGVLLIFAVDRYLAIVSPFHGSALSWRTVTAAFFIDIILSICFYLHYIFALKVDPINGSCYVPKVADHNFAIPNCLLIIFRLVLFVSVFTFTSIEIFKTLKKCCVVSVNREIRERRLKKSRRTIRVLLTMGVVFFLLVFPREILYFVYNLSWILFPTKGIILNRQLNEINSWLKVAHTANSCANVFVYSHLHTVYRKQFFKFISCFGGWKKKIFRINVSISQITSTHSSLIEKQSKCIHLPNYKRTLITDRKTE